MSEATTNEEFGFDETPCGRNAVIQTLGRVSAILVTLSGCSSIPASAPSPPCNYFTVAGWTAGVARDEYHWIPDARRASKHVANQVETAWLQAIEATGFRVPRGREPAAFLVLSNLYLPPQTPDVIVGSTVFNASPWLLRDWLFASEAGAIASGAGLETTSAEAIPHRGGRPEIDREHIQAAAERWANRVSPVLIEMCEWREGVIADGLTVEHLRRELVEEMIRIRREHREEKQRKDLKLEIEREGTDSDEEPP